MLKIEGLSKRLGSFSMQDVSFTVGEGDYFVLLGASGVGKTVLLETIAGVMRPDAGQVRLDGRDITMEKPQNRNIGLVYQDQALFPNLSVRQNIAYGLKCRGVGRSESRLKVKELAESLGALPLLDRDVESLSGGEAQRVALARTMATKPKCLLLDEPIASLDSKSRGEVRALLRDLNRRGQTILHVTHDYEEAVSLASRIAVMEDGRIVQQGLPESIFHNPKSEFVAGFVGIRNFFRGTLGQSSADGELSEFTGPGGIRFWVLTDMAPGAGCLIFRSEDVVISNERPKTSARNVFEGTILDIIPAKLGVEVSIQIGVEVSALLTKSSVGSLDLEIGKTVWVYFKASAVRFLSA
ncbi:MAG: ABC transporter ATP-binding protein [Candidatus Coatesbacteria bacterium]|nr:ABC transporter ATP-binding protein [Candidatus Coatesbacteria bacterium]